MPHKSALFRLSPADTKYAMGLVQKLQKRVRDHFFSFEFRAALKTTDTINKIVRIIEIFQACRRCKRHKIDGKYGLAKQLGLTRNGTYARLMVVNLTIQDCWRCKTLRELIVTSKVLRG